VLKNQNFDSSGEMTRNRSEMRDEDLSIKAKKFAFIYIGLIYDEMNGEMPEICIKALLEL